MLSAALDRPLRPASLPDGAVGLALADWLLLQVLRARGYRSRRLHTGGGVVHALSVRGSGTLGPVVVLHGLSSSAADYVPLLEALRPWFGQVLAPDLPGHGFSSLPAGGLDASGMRSTMIEALDALLPDRGEPAVLVGNSLGGLAAVRFAAERPERVRALVLLSPGGAPMAAPELRQFLQAFHLPDHARAVDFVDVVIGERHHARHLLAWAVRQRLERPSIRQLIGRIQPEDLLTPAEVASLSMPVLLVWGRREQLLPARDLAFFRAWLPPHAVVEEPPTWGHAPFINDGRALAERVASFVGGAVPVPAP